jgi:cytochrome c6
MKKRILAVLAISSLAVSQAQAIDLMRGQRLYNMHCSACHGLNGVPVMPQVPSFVSKEKLMQPDMMLLQTVKMGKNMQPPFFGILKDDEIIDILQYARTIR